MGLPKVEEVGSFFARLFAAPVTCGLLGANIVVFLVAESYGSTTDPMTLVRFGATEATIVWLGGWWRLGTAMFLHIGVIHLLWNTYALSSWCVRVETSLGRWRYLVTYLVSGVGGSFVSVLGHDVVSAGASGAGFGVIGATLVAGARAAPSVRAYLNEPETGRILRGTGLWFVMGLVAIPMDNFAHLGGFAAGLACATLLTSTMPFARSAALVAAGCTAMFVAGARPWHSHPAAAEVLFLDRYGYAYLTGKGFDKDSGRAERFLRLACDAGSPVSCTNLGGFVGQRGTPEADVEALGLYRKACAAGGAMACGLVGRYLTDGRGAPQDHGAGLAAFVQGCDGGDAVACASAAYGYAVGRGTAVDPSKGRALSRKACDLGNLDGCKNALHATDRDEDRAKLYQRACDLGWWDGCAGLADLRYRGAGVPLDPETGMEELQKACDKGSKWGCDRLNQLAGPAKPGDGGPLGQASEVSE